ncbi:putative ubiquinone biosynthesis protein UbiB [Candidatus Moduliflexus flocculans]|uniref:Putative ubiquinone biosynthesis protein UbiB n=1 Tax=Candidatus Moduliflexus flocculans TaxID=1499966 RepID=A0A0S6W431_9BACT|nr:putative ubiquinone biosynthesis protein UbiB [Candidatus Moduliflexus flocculans]
MNFMSIPQFTRNTMRFTEIVGVLGKYGLANWIPEQFPDMVKGFFKTADGVDLNTLSDGARLRLALTELGPTFIKLGQVLSTRVDLVGSELANELAELQSGTPADPPEVVRATIEAELGKPPEELFAAFDSEAIASASIGQAHLATLHNGQQVIVKVQHQGIEEKVETDLDILIALAKLAEQYDPELRFYLPQNTAAEFRQSLLRELDFRREMRNLLQFERNFHNNPAVHIPIAYPDLTTRRVLTMEQLNGYSIANVERLEQDGFDGKALVHTGANIFMDMIFRDRFYHADPHPGNIWVLSDGRIGLLDCGMIGRLDSRTQQGIEQILFAVISKDSSQLTTVVIRLSSAPLTLNRAALEADIEDFVAEHIEQAAADFDISNTLDMLAAIIRKHRILLPTGISSLIRLLIMLEGTVKMLDPEFKLFDILASRKVEFMQKRVSFDHLTQHVLKSYRDWERLLTMLPHEFAEILENFRSGRLEVHLAIRHLDSIVNRLVYAMLSAALFIGSSWILSASVPPLVKGVSVPGAGGCVVAAVLGLRLMYAVKKSGDLD